MAELTGTVERITYQNEENGYTVFKLKTPSLADPTCCVGFLPSIKPGETLCCKGEWKMNPKHGRQFEVISHETRRPADVEGIRKYLGSGLVKGIGPVYAERIVQAFGTETLNIIDSAPERLLDIPGIGKKKIERIIGCWQEQRSIREVMLFLQQYRVSPSFAQKIFKSYGPEAIQKVRENPYCLSRDIFGIGFKTADEIAAHMGIARDGPQRIEAGIEHTLSECSKEGHVCYPLAPFCIEAGALLEVNSDKVSPLIEKLLGEKRIAVEAVEEVPHLWLRPLFIAEKGIAKEVKRLQEGSSPLRPVDTDKALEWVQGALQGALSIKLATNQKDAVAAAIKEKVLIITGGPGTGKSTITKAILSISSKLTSKILLAAPTGRAAKRMSEITRHSASTIHALLAYSFQQGGFKKNKQNPLDCHLLIVDEASMIDTLLMYHLLRALPDHARLILVGDINQLPSVGPGNVLKDMISSQQVKVIGLNEIFRQAKGSQIIVNAHRINEGQLPWMNNLNDSDFFFIEALTPELVLEQVVGLVSERLPKKYGFDPMDEIQVLAPMRKGIIGTNNLNEVLQGVLNPSRDEPLLRHGQKFYVNDKVMQIRNNYKKEVYNGDIGRIEAIDREDELLILSFEGRKVEYEFSDLDELVPAYAVSIHKYQGSECPCVVLPVHTTHFKLLCRNLLYTGVTRGKKLVVLVGTKQAVAIAVHNDEVKNRHTALKHWLRR